MKLSSILHLHHSWRLAITWGLSLLLLACAPMSQPADEATSTDATVITDTTPVTATATVSPTTALTATATITNSTTTTTTTPIPDLSATEQQLVDQAMTLVATESGVAVAELTLTSMEAVEWPDSSLGCPQPDTMYMQVITPGYQITLTAADGQCMMYIRAATPMCLCCCVHQQQGNLVPRRHKTPLN